MFHSITFGEKNTWDDWHLIPETQPIVAPPPLKTNYIDIPGASGSLDMSEVLTGYPTYQNRTGSFSFLVTNASAASEPYHNMKKIHKVVEEVMAYLHGKRMAMILEDDPLYYYEGRFDVGETSIEEGFNKITINYNLDPYKWSINNSVDTNWEWDTFSFVDGVIYKGMLANIEVVNTASITIPGEIMGIAPIQPVFYMEKNSQSNYWYLNATYDGKYYQSGNIESAVNYTFDDFVVAGKDLTIAAYCSGTGGKLSINMRAGRL